MKRVLGFILTLILILNTVVTPGISVRAEESSWMPVRTSAMSRADKILGLLEYDEHGISESDADIYEYQVNLKYPTAYLVEAAEERFGFTDLMTVVNKFNNEEFRLHPEYYYEAALMSLLFEQAGDSSFLECNQQDVLAESSQAAGDLLNYAVGEEADALEELKKEKPDKFTEQEYLDSLNGLKKIENGAVILSKILGYAQDAYDVVLYAKNLEKILNLQEETITFLTEMKSRTNDINIMTAIDTVLNVYKANQSRPDDLINIIIQMDSTTMAFEKLAWTALETTWDVICASVPALKIIDLAVGISGFVSEYAFASDAISDAYAKLEAIFQLESIARETIKDMGEEYINTRAGGSDSVEELAEVFNVGWDFFTVLLDADCQASLFFAKATFNAGVADFDIWALFSGSGGYDEFAGYIKNYQGTIARWKNAVNMYMEGLKPENRKVDGATFREDYVEMEPGDTYILNMDLLPEDAVDKYIRYGIVSDDRPAGDTGLVASNDVVKIEGNKLIALAQGTVEIEGLAGDVGMRDTMIVYVGDSDMITSEGLLYRIEDGKRVIITGYEGDAARVEIPSYIDGLPVVEVETFTGENGRNITVKEVILPDSVTRIWNYAFYQCVSLQKINLEKVNYVGEYAFAYCSRLENVAFWSYPYLTVLNQYAFAQCTSLQAIDLSSAGRTIPKGLCYGCTSLKKVIFPEDLIRIYDRAFYNCGFEELYLPEYIMFLDEGCISHCENLRKFYIPDNSLVIPDAPEQFINAEDTVHYVKEGSGIHNLLEKWNSEGYDFKIAFTRELTIPQSSYTIAVGESVNVSYDQSPVMSDEIFIFSSDRPSIASITPDGVLTGIKPGKTEIKVESSYGQESPRCEVTVTAGSGSGNNPGGGSGSSNSGTNPGEGSSGSGAGQNGSQSGAGTGSGTSGSFANSSAPSNGDSSSGGSSSSTGQNGERVIKAKNIKKAKKSKKIKTATVGKAVQLKVKLSPANATEKPVWTSSKPKVATVSPDGKVTPKKKGKTKITARISNGKKVTWKIKVKELKAKKISLNKKKATLHAGETLKLKAKLKPKGSTAKIKWKSSKKKVASVSKNGTVTARKKGKAVITAQLPNGKKAKCKITVKKAVPQNGGSTGGNKNNGNTGGSNGQNHTNGNSNNGNTNSSNTSGGGTVTQPGGDTGNRPGENPGSGSGTSGDSQSPGDSGGQNPDEGQNPGGDGSEDENVPTKLTLATDHLTLKGRWQTIILSVEEETEASVGEKLEITAEPDSFYGDSQILDAEITEGNDMQRIHWSSDDETIVKVYNGGLIRGVRTGTTTITATTTDGTTAECKVTVEDADLQWESSDMEVAAISSVDSDGRTAHITAGKEGTADITVCSGSYQSTCRLTVSADSTDPEDPTEPTDPTDSTEPTEPTDPTDSTDPTEPTDPTDSTDPTEPTDPDDSDDPVNPDAQTISTVEDLKAIANDLDGDYILTNDIDISGENWTPIGTREEPFKGTLDGDGHTISGLTIKEDSFVSTGTNYSSSYYGLFGMVAYEVEISHLTVQGEIVITETAEDETIKNRNIFVGGFVGDAKRDVQFVDCTSKVDITVNIKQTENGNTTVRAGGINGGDTDNNVHIYFTDCCNEGDLDVQLQGRSAWAMVGGLQGDAGVDVNFYNCKNSGEIRGNGQASSGGVAVYAGGIVGRFLVSHELIQCENHGDVTAFADTKADDSVVGTFHSVAGGIIGYSGKEAVVVTDPLNTGIITAYSPNPKVKVASGEIQGKIVQEPW